MKLRVKDLVLLSLVILLVGCGGNSSSPMDVVDDSQVSNPSNPTDSMAPVNPADPIDPVDNKITISGLSGSYDQDVFPEYLSFIDIQNIQLKISFEENIPVVVDQGFLPGEPGVCVSVSLDLSDAVYIATDMSFMPVVLTDVVYSLEGANFEDLVFQSDEFFQFQQPGAEAFQDAELNFENYISISEEMGTTCFKSFSMSPLEFDSVVVKSAAGEELYIQQ